MRKPPGKEAVPQTEEMTLSYGYVLKDSGAISHKDMFFDEKYKHISPKRQPPLSRPSFLSP
jgi:hypothetical protein